MTHNLGCDWDYKSNWFGASKADPRVAYLFSHHYSSRKGGKTIRDWQRAGITANGESMTLITPDACALFVWLRQNKRDDGEVGVNCAVFRNEAPGLYLSSDLILEAEQLAWDRWPGERLFTFVDGREVSGDGACFKHAGWRKLNRRTKHGLIILEKYPTEAQL